MPRIPGTHNGGIPPDIVWNENDPPIKNSCTQGPMHGEDCDGKCDPLGFMVESEVMMVNEFRAWGRAHMHIGKVAMMRSRAELEWRLNALIDFLAEQGIIDMDELNEFWRKYMVDRMQKIRLENEEDVKRNVLGLPPKKIIGPDGQPL